MLLIIYSNDINTQLCYIYNIYSNRIHLNCLSDDKINTYYSYITIFIYHVNIVWYTLYIIYSNYINIQLCYIHIYMACIWVIPFRLYYKTSHIHIKHCYREEIKIRKNNGMNSFTPITQLSYFFQLMDKLNSLWSHHHSISFCFLQIILKQIPAVINNSVHYSYIKHLKFLLI